MKIMSNPRIRHYVARASVFLITATLIVGMAGCVGGGSQNLEIQDWYDLDAVRDNLAGHHTLMKNLDSSTPGYEELASPTANGGRGWQPIGTGDDLFAGNFDGKGYEIRDLCINRTDEWWAGLFFGVAQGGVIKDMGVIANITSIGSSGEVGGLTAVNLGTVSNCYVTGSVTGADMVGGLVGINAGNVSNCYAAGCVTGAVAVGGLVADNGGSISDSYSSGSVIGFHYVGGLVGWNGGTVGDSYSNASVTGNELVGGLVGYSSGTVSNSYSTGNVTGNESVGGLVGFNDGTVSNSYYNYGEALISGQSIITVGALLDEDFDEWLTNDKFLDVNDRLSREDGYYLINDIGDFKQLLAFGQNGTLKFRLSNDLDLADEPNFYIPYLAGEFSGSGHKISNLSFNFDFVSQIGLFGYLAPGANIAGMGVENINIAGASFVGGLVGYNREGTVNNSHSIGIVTGDWNAGGLVGTNRNGTVGNSYSTANVTGYAGWVGGLVGANRQGIVSDSYSTGSVTGTCGVGGLVGSSELGTVSSSYSTGSVTGYTDYVGGLVGSNGGTVSNSYATGSVTGERDVGGLVGSNYDGIVGNSYSTGSVTGNSSVGGLVGSNHAGNVSNCYAAGNVSGSSNTGGLMGYSWNSTVMNSFWDTETSGQATSDGGTGKNTTEMQDIVTFSVAGWNIIPVSLNETNPAYIWNIVSNVTYPFLGWQV